MQAMEVKLAKLHNTNFCPQSNFSKKKASFFFIYCSLNKTTWFGDLEKQS